MSEPHLPYDAPAGPAIELLAGDATQAPTAGSSLMARLARGTLYSVALLAATALLAVSAVPELASSMSFLLGSDQPACGALASSGSCTTLDAIEFADSSEFTDSPCCALKVAVAAATPAAGCCAMSCQEPETEVLLGATEALPPCCAAAAAGLLADQPIDAGSLLAATAEEPVDEQRGQQRSELDPDHDVVEE